MLETEVLRVDVLEGEVVETDWPTRIALIIEEEEVFNALLLAFLFADFLNCLPNILKHVIVVFKLITREQLQDSTKEIKLVQEMVFKFLFRELYIS